MILIPLLICVLLAALYAIGHLLVKGGMRYGFITILYLLTDMGLVALQKDSRSFRADAESHASLVITCLLIAYELTYAILQQTKAAVTTAKVYHFIAAGFPALSFICFVPVGLWADKNGWGEMAMFSLLIATNLASALYNLLLPAEHKGNGNTMMILLAIVMLVICFFGLAFTDFTLPL